MTYDTQLNDIQRDLQYFFDHARENDEFNAQLASTYIDKWDYRFAFMSAAMVAQRIQRLPLMLNGLDVIEMGMRNISIAESLYRAYGNQAGTLITQTLPHMSDEDCLAITAYILASNNLADARHIPAIWNVIKRANNPLVGSSCKLTLAFALHKCGESEELLSYLELGYLCPKSIASGMAKKIRQENRHSPSKLQRELGEMLDFFAVPGLDPHSGAPYSLGVLGTLVLDIRTNGEFAQEGYLAELQWTRKQYPEE